MANLTATICIGDYAYTMPVGITAEELAEIPRDSISWDVHYRISSLVNEMHRELERVREKRATANTLTEAEQAQVKADADAE
jgi:hypothetical protein